MDAIPDLEIAARCARGEPEALAWFDGRFLARVDRIAFRLGAPPALAAEVKQLLRFRLLVADAGPPAIATFRGEGPLHGWVAIAASRLLWRLMRERRRSVDDVAALEEAIAPDDPELECCRRDAADEMAEAFRQAVESLGPTDRELLQRSALGGQSIDELAGAFGIHRATVARRLERIRGELRARTRAELSSRLALSGPDVDSLVRFVIGLGHQSAAPGT